MPGKVVLNVVGGPLKGRTFPFEEHDTFVFGRAPDCHLQLPAEDPTASRHHFLLEVNPPAARLRELGSLNGTYVNDVKHGGRGRHETPEEAARRDLPQVDLRHGDTIRVGETRFRLEVELPASCCDCGRPAADEEESDCGWIGGGFICPACRVKAAEPTRPRAARSSPVCQHCGKRLPSDDGSASRGDYVCVTCQATVDPAALLKRSLSPGGVRVAPVAGPPGYELGRMIGRGGMGAVYEARRVRDGTTVAVKILLARVSVEDYARQAFEREIEVTRALRHPNCVELIDHGSSGVGFYFVMELCTGRSVADLMVRRRRALPVPEATAIALQAVEGLAFAHSRGFVHRDLKPENVLLTAASGGVAKISDFGLAKSFARAGLAGPTVTGAAGGTLAFMPREQLTNFKNVKPVSDVFSMGATLYCMLTGKLPRDFPRGQDPVLAILQGRVVPVRERDPSIPEPLARVVDRAVADDGARRYAAGAERHEALLGARSP
jgi:hypothetical protein